MMPAGHTPGHPHLRQLLEGLVASRGLPPLVPSSLAMDSRLVVPGGLFMACAGGQHHGMGFARDAANRRAIAILAEPAGTWDEWALAEAGEVLGIPVIPVPQLSAHAGEIAARFHADPSAAMQVVGITGTNGKTSVSHYLAQALSADRRCGVIGTLGYGLPGALHEASHTTPDAVRLQAELAGLQQDGADSVAMEVSSHALHQHRVAGVRFHAAVFTNLSRDHLDYHGDMAHYGEVKAGLFDCPGLQLAVINVDDDFGRQLAVRAAGRLRVIACRSNSEAPAGIEAVRASDIKTGEDGLRFTLTIDDWQGQVHSPLLGRFNVDNLLLVAGVLYGWGVPLEGIAGRLGRLRTVPGRMEAFSAAGKPRVVVDYAHTPDALEKALQALRPHTGGRLHCLFGCGGERDTGKRPLMGEVAERLADRVTLSDDNPRGEDGSDIVEQILAGMSRPGEVSIERNRAHAIEQAIAAAAPGDLVLVAGKGHEDYQQVGHLRLPFSDAEHVCRALGVTTGGAA
jgi:UDP-N-acetylmuramoyl-L-alanyl-D-glutamate--2,6-diaminopimelate ligase